MCENRIWFRDNPWPEGHRIESFDWTAEIRADGVWFRLDLTAERYFTTRDLTDEESETHDTDWQSPIVWRNYHQCYIESTAKGFRACDLSQYSPQHLDGLTLRVDPLPIPPADLDDLVFSIYLLGHDTCADHTLSFKRRENSDHFDVEWKGKVELSYLGHFDCWHDFTAIIFDVPMPVPVATAG